MRSICLIAMLASTAAAEPARPQEPHRPFPYREQEVSISVRAAPRDPRRTERVTLAGTLTLPEGKGPFPAVLLITGSGPQDRDETVFGHKPFLVIADALTRRGIATLRIDDRGVGGSGGASPDLTTLDFAEDVRSELAYLAARPEIDPRAVGLLGHSEGAVIGPIVAASSPQARFVVMLAGTGTDGMQVMIEQAAAVARAAGMQADQIERDRVGRTALFRVLRASHDAAEIDAAIHAFVDGQPGSKPLHDAAATAFRAPWLRAFLALDPAPYLSKLQVPVLALAGEHDLQVLPDNLPKIEAALTRGGNRDVTARMIAGVNHLFQHSETGAPMDYPKISETFAPEALSAITDWIVERTRRLTAPAAPRSR